MNWAEATELNAVDVAIGSLSDVAWIIVEEDELADHSLVKFQDGRLDRY